MHPVLITIFGFPIHTFGVMVLLGVLAGLHWIKHDARRLGLDGEDVASLGVEVFLAGLIGSRVFFVWHNWDKIYGPILEAEGAASALLATVNIRMGGLVWYGGLLAALPVCVWRMRHYKMDVIRACDLLAPGTILGLGIGRIGCLMAGDDHGRICVVRDDLQGFLATKPPGFAQSNSLFLCDQIPWYAIRFTDDMALVAQGYKNEWLLPSQPLMTLGCMTIFVILISVRKRLQMWPGAVVALLFVLYPIERYLIELTRGDNVRGHIAQTVPIVGGMSTSQAISVALLPFGLAGFAAAVVLGRRRVARLLAEGKDPMFIPPPPERGPDGKPLPAKADAPAPAAPAPATPAPATSAPATPAQAAAPSEPAPAAPAPAPAEPPPPAAAGEPGPGPAP